MAPRAFHRSVREARAEGAGVRPPQGRPALDVVLSDMAPNMSGMDVIEHAKSAYLGELTLDMADKVLKPHCHALIKVFQGAWFQELVQAARGQFSRVKLQKPAASAGPER